VLPEIEDGNDVRVAQRRSDVCFVEEHAHERLVRSECRQNPLEDDGLLESFGADLPRREDLGHASIGDLSKRAIPHRRRHHARIVSLAKERQWLRREKNWKSFAWRVHSKKSVLPSANATSDRRWGFRVR